MAKQTYLITKNEFHNEKPYRFNIFNKFIHVLNQNQREIDKINLI
jgi:hypothetical protein